MRPRSQKMRQEYTRAAAQLRARNAPVTPKTLAKELSKKHPAVHKFLSDNPDFAAEIGAIVQRHSLVLSFTAEQPKREAPHESPPPVAPLRFNSQWQRGVTVKYFDARRCQTVLEKVSPEQYVALWEGGCLFFQRMKLPKPGPLPTREEMLQFVRRTSDP